MFCHMDTAMHWYHDGNHTDVPPIPTYKTDEQVLEHVASIMVLTLTYGHSYKTIF